MAGQRPRRGRGSISRPTQHTQEGVHCCFPKHTVKVRFIYIELAVQAQFVSRELCRPKFNRTRTPKKSPRKVGERYCRARHGCGGGATLGAGGGVAPGDVGEPPWHQVRWLVCKMWELFMSQDKGNDCSHPAFHERGSRPWGTGTTPTLEERERNTPLNLLACITGCHARTRGLIIRLNYDLGWFRFSVFLQIKYLG